MYRLLIKQHRDTGLKYLCKTTVKHYMRYTGSGKYWHDHLKKHGKNLDTTVVFETEDFEEFKKVCLEKSIEFDVVASNEWANLTEERGDNGMPGDTNPLKRPEVRAKVSAALMGNKHGSGNNNQIGNKWNLGKKRSAETKALQSARKKGRTWYKDPETGKRVWV